MTTDRVLLKAWNAMLGRDENLHASYNAIKGVVSETERIHSGNSWLHSEAHYNLAAGDSISHLIIPNSGGGVDLHLSNIGYNTTAGPAELEVYEAPFININSFGADITSSFFNRNRTRTNVRGFVIREDPFIDVNSIGVLLDYSLIEASAGGPIKASGGAAGAASEMVLDNTKQYLLRHTNQSANVASYTSSRVFIYRADI